MIKTALLITLAIKLVDTTSKFYNKAPISRNYVRYLETNSWIVNIDPFEIAIDPVLAAPLDFGIPLLYTGRKRLINGLAELDTICQAADYILLSQGLDDHAHKPTLKALSKRRPTMPYICPPSAVAVLKSCGISSSYITVISPGQQIKLSKNNKVLQITATAGALVGPPWQACENGYVIKSLSSATPSIYYEPHCMYDESELSRYQVDYIITPVVAQQLPKFTLVAGGAKAVRLAEILRAKTVIPMANGELEQTGVLASIIRTEGSTEEFVSSVKEQNLKLKVLSVVPGDKIALV